MQVARSTLPEARGTAAHECVEFLQRCVGRDTLAECRPTGKPIEKVPVSLPRFAPLEGGSVEAARLADDRDTDRQRIHRRSIDDVDEYPWQRVPACFENVGVKKIDENTTPGRS